MPKRPPDINQLAKTVVDMTTGAAHNDSHDANPRVAHAGVTPVPPSSPRSAAGK